MAYSSSGYSSSGDLRSRLAASLRKWFNWSRWTTADKLVALAGPVIAVAVFLPWFKATVRFRTSQTTGYLMDPPGTLTGFAAHGYLLLAIALALLESAVIVARYFPGRRAPRLPFHRYFIVAASGAVCLVVLAAALFRPAAWYGNLQLPPPMYITIEWTYGSMTAVAAALIAQGFAVAALRSDGF
jgi:hypothetical protein